MIEEVTIYNRFNMETFAHPSTDGLNFPYKEKNWSLVSIYTTPEEEFLTEKRILALKALGMKEYVSVCFWDIDNDPVVLKDYPEAILFNEEMGKDIISLITRAEGWDDAVLVAHCDAGISRSGAVGTFAVEYLRLDYEKFIKDNPYTKPNPLVMRTLRSLYGGNYQSAFGEVK